MQAVESEYHPNPYHSSLHAADVTQALAAILASDGIARQLSDLELLALLVAAVVHDLGHPGARCGTLAVGCVLARWLRWMGWISKLSDLELPGLLVAALVLSTAWGTQVRGGGSLW